MAPGERQPTRVPVRKDADPTAEVYVDALAGSDSNPGTIQSPVQTISKVGGPVSGRNLVIGFSVCAFRLIASVILSVRPSYIWPAYP